LKKEHKSSQESEESSLHQGEVFIHPMASVSKGAELGPGVSIGPFCTVGPQVVIGAGTRLISHVVLDGKVIVGQGNTFYPFSSAGLVPQDLKYHGEPSWVEIGDRNTIRESVTIHRGTEGGGMLTRLGDGNLLMAYVHVAHDCRLGSRIIMANASNLAGHITIEDGAIIGGLTGIHQFVKIGALSLVGGMSGISKDVPPYVWASGNRAFLYGLNMEGLRRARISPDSIAALKKAYSILFRGGKSQKSALDEVRDSVSLTHEVTHLLSFIEQSGRGILTARRSDEKSASGDQTGKE
jgi:UDP-N-acetylglucosamine acyltransferase